MRILFVEKRSVIPVQVNELVDLYNSRENEEWMVDHQTCLNGIPHIRSLLKESGNLKLLSSY